MAGEHMIFCRAHSTLVTQCVYNNARCTLLCSKAVAITAIMVLLRMQTRQAVLRKLAGKKKLALMYQTRVELGKPVGM